MYRNRDKASGHQYISDQFASDILLPLVPSSPPTFSFRLPCPSLLSLALPPSSSVLLFCFAPPSCVAPVLPPPPSSVPVLPFSFSPLLPLRLSPLLRFLCLLLFCSLLVPM